jgi:hypothetical protein
MDSRLKAAFENRNLVFVVGTGVTAAVTKEGLLPTRDGPLRPRTEKKDMRGPRSALGSV